MLQIIQWNIQRKNVRGAAALCLILVLLFCGAGAVRSQPDASDRSELVIGSGPYYSTDAMQKGFAPLVEYLSGKLNRKVTFVVTETYGELAEKVESGAIDIGFFGAVLYVQIKQKNPHLKYLVTSQSFLGGKKTSYCYSWLLSKKDSGIIKVKHLRGKSFAFTDSHSTSGYIYPLGYLKKRRLRPQDFFAQVIFAGSHAKVTDMIAQEEVESGVSSEVNLQTAEEKYGRIFRRIRKVGPMLNPSFAAGAQVDLTVCEQIISALENLPRRVLNNDFPYMGFQRLSETNFAPVAELLKTLEGAAVSADGQAVNREAL
ncbi:MAG: phosphate/phosphite/phosphonate ABC transporter substrate-binding protein [Candidatus Electrothrix sp. YB6]